MIRIKQKGDFKNTEKYLKSKKDRIIHNLERYGEEGVQALAAATPKRSGLTASSWYYKIEYGKESSKISWHNSNIVDGYPIAVLIQYGHGTGTGGFVQGIDYINPAIQPVFERIADAAWKEVTKI